MRLVLILLLFSCATTNSDSSGNLLSANSNLDTVDLIVDEAIQSNNTDGLPVVKKHTKQVRTDVHQMDEKNILKDEIIADLKAQLDEHNKWIEWIYMFAPLGIGIVSLVFGRLTNSPSDTAFGIALCIGGFIFYLNYDIVDKYGLIAMVIAVIAWLIWQHEQNSLKKIDSEVD